MNQLHYIVNHLHIFHPDFLKLKLFLDLELQWMKIHKMESKSSLKAFGAYLTGKTRSLYTYLCITVRFLVESLPR